MRMRRLSVLAASFALVAGLFPAVAGAVLASSTVVVTPAATAGWGLLASGDVAVTTGNATGKIVAGPGGQPGGLLPGSLEYHTNNAPGGKPQLYAPASLTVSNSRT